MRNSLPFTTRLVSVFGTYKTSHRLECCYSSLSFLTVSLFVLPSNRVSANDMHQAEALWTEMYKDYINGNHFAEPDVVVCNRILTGWARSNDNAAVDRAEIMLQHMWKLHDAGLPDIRPTVGSYNSIIFCWKHSRRPYAPTRVDSILHEMGRFFKIGRIEKPPSHVSFREAIKTWKQSAYSHNKSMRISMLERELYKRFGIVDDGSKGVPRGGRGGN
jgi:hypothetical protein